MKCLNCGEKMDVKRGRIVKGKYRVVFRCAKCGIEGWHLDSGVLEFQFHLGAK